MLQQLPHLPLKIIFHFISFDDIVHLTKVPEIRHIVLDFYKREENRKDLIHRSLIDTIQSIFVPSHCILFLKYEKYFIDKGMKPFRTTHTFKQIKGECIRGFTNDEILNLRGGIQFDVITEKIEYIVNNYDFTDLYDFIDDLQNDDIITDTRREELYSIIYNGKHKYEVYFSKHLIQFVNEYLRTKNGFERTLNLVEFTFDWIYDIYGDTMNNTFIFPPTFIKKGMPMIYKNFINNIDKILKNIEFIFYS